MPSVEFGPQLRSQRAKPLGPSVLGSSGVIADVVESGCTDTFNRPDGNPGTSDSGHTWTNEFIDPESQIESGRLHIIRSGALNQQTTHLTIPEGVIGPWDAVFTWQLTGLVLPAVEIINYATPPGLASQGWVELYPGAGSYSDGIRSYGGPDKLQLIMSGTTGAGSYTWTEFSFPFEVGVDYRMRWFFDGAAVRVKIWFAGSQEPTAWMFEHEPASPVGYNDSISREFSVGYIPAGSDGTDEIIIENLCIQGVDHRRAVSSYVSEAKWGID